MRIDFKSLSVVICSLLPFALSREELSTKKYFEDRDRKSSGIKTSDDVGVDIPDLKYAVSHKEQIEAKTHDLLVTFNAHGMDEKSVAIPSSPECWKSAIAIIQILGVKQIGDPDAAKLCQILPEEHQKRLALEIARCHLEDLGRPLFESKKAEAMCEQKHYHRKANPSDVEADGETGDIHWCLKQLTDYGVNAYTQHFAYVSSLCIRLTQELVISYQRATQNELAKRYAEISTNSLVQLESIGALTQKHADHMQALSLVPDLVREKINNDIQVTLKNAVENTLGEQVELQMKIFDSQVQGMERHLAKMDAQREAMEEAVKRTKQTMQPILKLQTLMETATQSYDWLAFLLHFLGAFNLVWLVTRLQRCQPFRVYLFGVILIEAVLEMALAALVKNNFIAEMERVNLVALARQWLLLLECALYVLGILASFLGCFPTKEDVSTAEACKRESELVTKLKATLEQSSRVLADAEASSTVQNALIVHGPPSMAQNAPTTNVSPSKTPATIWSPSMTSFPVSSQLGHLHDTYSSNAATVTPHNLNTVSFGFGDRFKHSLYATPALATHFSIPATSLISQDNVQHTNQPICTLLGPFVKASPASAQLPNQTLQPPSCAVSDSSNLPSDLLRQYLLSQRMVSLAQSKPSIETVETYHDAISEPTIDNEKVGHSSSHTNSKNANDTEAVLQSGSQKRKTKLELRDDTANKRTRYCDSNSSDGDSSTSDDDSCTSDDDSSTSDVDSSSSDVDSSSSDDN